MSKTVSFYCKNARPVTRMGACEQQCAECDQNEWNGLEALMPAMNPLTAKAVENIMDRLGYKKK